MTPRRFIIGTWVLFLIAAHTPLAAGQGGSSGLMTPVCLDFIVILALAVTPVETLVSVGTELLRKFAGVSPSE